MLVLVLVLVPVPRGARWDGKKAGARHTKKTPVFFSAQLLAKCKRDKQIGDKPSRRDRTNLPARRRGRGGGTGYAVRGAGVRESGGAGGAGCGRAVCGVYGCTGVRVSGCTGVRVYGCTGARVHGCTGVRVYGQKRKNKKEEEKQK